MEHFTYVYVLVSGSHPSRRYTGLTTHLVVRLNDHNSGKVASTTRHRPWRIETAIAFRSRNKARAFERYLKSHSGRAFASRHF